MEPLTATKNQHQQKVADELKHLLADTYALYLKTQNFHWNVTGPNFQALHLMFENQYQELAAAVDEIAERIRALETITPASFTEFSKLTSLKEATGAYSAEEMLKALQHDHETLADHISSVIPTMQKAQDEGSADLLIQRVKVHQKTAWMLRSSLPQKK